MAGRPRNRHPNLYSTTEIAETTGLSPRNAIYLCERKELPVVTGGEGSGSHRLLDEEGLARAAVTAALHQAGIGLIAAARIAGVAWARKGLELRPVRSHGIAAGVPLPASLFVSRLATGDQFLEIYDGRFIALCSKLANRDDGSLVTITWEALGVLADAAEPDIQEAEQVQHRFDTQERKTPDDSPPESPLWRIFTTIRGFVESKKTNHRTCLSVNVSMVLRQTAERMQKLKAQ
jgi:hypothetical protein